MAMHAAMSFPLPSQLPNSQHLPELPDGMQPRPLVAHRPPASDAAVALSSQGKLTHSLRVVQ